MIQHAVPMLHDISRANALEYTGVGVPMSFRRFLSLRE